MAEGTTTNHYRQRLARFFYDETPAIALAKFTHMGFGDGGLNEDGSVKTMDPDQTELKNLLLLKSLDSIAQEDVYSVTGEGVLESEELIGAEISEAGLFDEEGAMVGFRNFLPKAKDADEELAIRIKIKF